MRPSSRKIDTAKPGLSVKLGFWLPASATLRTSSRPVSLLLWHSACQAAAQVDQHVVDLAQDRACTLMLFTMNESVEKVNLLAITFLVSNRSEPFQLVSAAKQSSFDASASPNAMKSFPRTSTLTSSVGW